jgi:hypothetical protein
MENEVSECTVEDLIEKTRSKKGEKERERGER